MTGSPPSVDRGPGRAGTLPLTALFTLAITGFVMLMAVTGMRAGVLDREPAYAMSDSAELRSTCLGGRVAALSSSGIEVVSAPEFSSAEDDPAVYHCVLGWTVAGEILANTLTIQVNIWDGTAPEYSGTVDTAEDSENMEVTTTAVPGFAHSVCTLGGTASAPDTNYVCRLSDANLEVSIYHGIWAGDAAAFGPESADMIALAADIGEAAKAAFRA